MAARILLEVLQTIFLIYLARRSPHAYGNLMLALGIGTILCIVADFGLDLALVVWLGQHSENRSEILATISVIKGILFAVGWLGVLGFVHWQEYDQVLKAVVLVVGVGFGMQSLAAVFFVTLQVDGRQDMESRIRAMASILGFGYGIAAIFLGASLLVVSFFKVIESLVCCILSAVAVARQTPFNSRSLGWKRVLKTLGGALVFACIPFAQILNDKINILFLKRYGGAWEIAQYSAAWQLVEGVAMFIVGLMLRSILYPALAGLWNSDPAEGVRLARNTALWLLLASIPIMFVLHVESSRVIQLVYGPQYREAVWIQKYLVATVPMNFMQFTAAYLMLSMGKERVLLFIYLLVLSLDLSWCLVAIPEAPAMGTVGSIVLAKIVTAALTMSYCQVKIGLIPARPFLTLLFAGMAGVGVYVLSAPTMAAELALIMALLPVLFLAWKWKKFGFRRPLQDAAV